MSNLGDEARRPVRALPQGALQSDHLSSTGRGCLQQRRLDRCPSSLSARGRRIRSPYYQPIPHSPSPSPGGGWDRLRARITHNHSQSLTTTHNHSQPLTLARRSRGSSTTPCSLTSGLACIHNSPSGIDGGCCFDWRRRTRSRTMSSSYSTRSASRNAM